MERHELGSGYRRNRARSERLFGLIDERALHDRPIPLRHPFVFYQGHLPAFSYLTLNERALGQAPIDAALEKLFERGIDPRSQTQAERLQPQTWPSPQEIAEFGQRCDERVLDALANARLDDPSVPRLRRGQSAYTILEHEQMHHETLLYLIHQLPYDRKTPVKQVHVDTPPPRNDLVAIPAGRATLGARPDEIPFGWDNEFGASTVDQPSFAIQRFPVTNGDWLAFVRAGGPAAPFWRERDGRWCLQASFEELPLPLSWPVYVSHDAAAAYAAAASCET